MKSGEPPMLHGDGLTDDTDAVQWYIDHDMPLPKGARYAADVRRLRGSGFLAAGQCRPDSAPEAVERTLATDIVESGPLDE